MDMIFQITEYVSQHTGLKPWALSVFLVVLAAVLLDFVQRRVIRRVTDIVRKTSNLWDDALLDAVPRPLSLVIWLVGVTMAAQLIPSTVEGQLLHDDVVVKIRQVGVLGALTWFLVVFVLNLENSIIATARARGRAVDQTTVKALGRVVRITVVVTAVLVGLDTLGFNVAGLMAAGGIGGLAIGFAAKDMLANLFGGLTVFIDRPFGIGDWIIIKTNGIEGVVEHIGWRQTTIRKFDKRPVYVPNAIFTTASVENPSRMTNRRLYETIGIRYCDIARMEAITRAVKDMLAAHPEIDEKLTLMVNFDAISESSMDFFIYCLTHTTDWQRYHEIKQDVLLKINAIIEQHGASMALPVRRLQVEQIPELAGLGLAAGDAGPPAGKN
jgi:MscS family membrane protein